MGQQLGPANCHVTLSDLKLSNEEEKCLGLSFNSINNCRLKLRGKYSRNESILYIYKKRNERLYTEKQNTGTNNEGTTILYLINVNDF